MTRPELSHEEGSFFSWSFLLGWLVEKKDMLGPCVALCVNGTFHNPAWSWHTVELKWCPSLHPKNVIDSSRESKKLSTSTLINTAALEVLKPHQLRANPETSLSCIPRKPSKSFFRYPPFLGVFVPQSSGEMHNSDVVAPCCPCWVLYSKFFNYFSFFSKFGPQKQVTSIQIINCNSPRTLNIFRRQPGWWGGWGFR